jgi:putative membrane protein
MKHSLATLSMALTAAAASLACGSAQAQTPAQGRAMSAAAAPRDTATYLQKAASGDLFEIQSSQVALSVSRNQAVRDFAQMLVDDHTRMSAEMQTAAASAGTAPPAPALLPPHAQKLRLLRATPPARFDAAYRREQIAAHQEALALHRGYATAGAAAALKAVAAKAVPIIEHHLQTAQSLPSR